MKFVEDIGLVKFDFLGLKNLTLIQDTLELIKAGGKTLPDLNRLPLDDPDAYRLLARGDTVGVFQMEGSGMRRFVTDLKPTCFDDIIAAGSLFRPGPLDAVVDGKTMVQHYVDRKHGREQVQYPHPLLEPVLRDTYGVIIYQEQVMRVAQALAGYTLEQADILRAAMGKKNKAVMEKERERFIQGAVKSGVDKDNAQSIFEQIETFASYGFNRSHAAAYALTTYTTAYLKAHYPYEFMAALTSLDMDDVDKTYKNIAALRDMGIKLLPPDVNQSRVKFTVVPEAIRFGMGAIRGVGAKTAQAIIAAREDGGRFTSLTDLCMRADPQQLLLCWRKRLERRVCPTKADGMRQQLGLEWRHRYREHLLGCAVEPISEALGMSQLPVRGVEKRFRRAIRRRGRAGVDRRDGVGEDVVGVVARGIRHCLSASADCPESLRGGEKRKMGAGSLAVRDVRHDGRKGAYE